MFEGFEGIKSKSNISRNQSHAKIKFANILKIRMKENAMLYLKKKQKSKGKEIIYTNIEMADYLQPINSKLTIEQKQQMFAVRNRMCPILKN